MNRSITLALTTLALLSWFVAVHWTRCAAATESVLKTLPENTSTRNSISSTRVTCRHQADLRDSSHLPPTRP